MSDDEYADEPLDPRVQVELEKLNNSAEELNDLEMRYIDTRKRLKATVDSATDKLQSEAELLSKSLKRSRPYFDHLRTASELRPVVETHRKEFQAAKLNFDAAKETLALAELRLTEDETASLDAAWQDMFNYSTIKLMEYERKKRSAESLFSQTKAKYDEAERKISKHQRKNGHHIDKALPYMELKESLNNEIEMMKDKIQLLQTEVNSKKAEYKGALANLERISEEVLNKRKLQMTECNVSDNESDYSSLPDLNLADKMDWWSTSSEFSSSERESVDCSDRGEDDEDDDDDDDDQDADDDHNADDGDDLFADDEEMHGGTLKRRARISIGSSEGKERKQSSSSETKERKRNAAEGTGRKRTLIQRPSSISQFRGDSSDSDDPPNVSSTNDAKTKGDVDDAVDEGEAGVVEGAVVKNLLSVERGLRKPGDVDEDATECKNEPSDGADWEDEPKGRRVTVIELPEMKGNGKEAEGEEEEQREEEEEKERVRDRKEEKKAMLEREKLTGQPHAVDGISDSLGPSHVNNNNNVAVTSAPRPPPRTKHNKAKIAATSLIP